MRDANQKRFIRIFAAVLPLAGNLVSLPRAFWLATILGAIALFTTYLFALMKPLFPAKLFRLSIILFLAVLFQISMRISHLTPFWIVSLGLLLDWNDFDPKHLAQAPLPPLVRVGIFWCGILFLGVIREVLGNQMEIKIFAQPAGTLAAFAFFAVLMASLEKPLAPLWMPKRKKK